MEEVRDDSIESREDAGHERVCARDTSLVATARSGRGGNHWSTVVGVEHLQTLSRVENRERDAELGGDVSEGVVVGVANERVVPVDYLLDHVQFVVMVIGG